MTGLSLDSWQVVIAAILAVFGSGGLGALVVKMMEHKRGVRRQTDDQSIRLVHEMRERMATVEASAAAERASDRRMFDREIGRSERQHVMCEARLKVEHHRGNNLRAEIDGLMDMLTLAPDKVPDIVRISRERSIENRRTESNERNALLELQASLGFPADADEPQEEEGHG